MFPIQNGLKEGDALSLLLFMFALEYAIRRVQLNQSGLKLNGTHHLLVYVNDNILGGSVSTIEKNIEVASKEIGLEVNGDKTKDMVMSRDQNAGRSVLKVGNACHHLVQNLFSSSFLSEDLKIEIYRTIILRVVLYGCETCYLKLKVESRLSVFENRTLRRIFGPKRDEVKGSGKINELNYQHSSLNIIRVMKSRRMRWTGHVAYTGERKGVYRVLVRNREGKTEA